MVAASTPMIGVEAFVVFGGTRVTDEWAGGAGAGSASPDRGGTGACRTCRTACVVDGETPAFRAMARIEAVGFSLHQLPHPLVTRRVRHRAVPTARADSGRRLLTVDT